MRKKLLEILENIRTGATYKMQTIKLRHIGDN